MPDLNYKITTTAELAGAQAAADALEKQIGKAKALKQDYSELQKQLDTVNDSMKESAVKTDDLSTATDSATEKFGSSRREIRMLGNELGRVAGVSQGGMLFLGGVATAAFIAAKAVGFLAQTWRDIQEAIAGPLKIDIDIPSDVAGRISAVAEAWNSFADARAKVIAAANTPQAEASREEKKLQNELKLIKEVLAAEEKKALIEAGDDKEAKARIKEQFENAGKAADEETRKKVLEVKQNEVKKLTADAQKKLQEAGQIGLPDEKTEKETQKKLDENAAAAAAAQKEIKEKLARNKRLADEAHDPGSQAEYSGVAGWAKKEQETWEFAKDYGWTGTGTEAKALENTRLMQAQAAIDTAENYRRENERKRKQKKELTEEAGKESGQAEVLSGEIADAQQAPAQAADEAHALEILKTRGGQQGKTLEDLANATGSSHEQIIAMVNKILDHHLTLQAAFTGLDAKLKMIESRQKAHQIQ
jgi:hypothetical protein